MIIFHIKKTFLCSRFQLKYHETILVNASRRIYVGDFVGGRQKDRKGFDDAAKSAKVESVDKDDGTEKTF